MRLQKKWMMVLACILAVALMAGCGANKAESQKTETNAGTESVSETTAESSSDADETTAQSNEEASGESGTGKILIAYFSGTGNTKAAAETIAAATNGELFELQPVEAYSAEDLDYNDPSSRVCREHDDADLQDVALNETTPADWDDVQYVLIGYPIWWGEAAWPVNNFVKNNDFTGKTVIPFCTSASSGLDDSGDLLEKMAGTGNWMEGKRFSSNVSDIEVQEWVDGLQLN